MASIAHDPTAHIVLVKFRIRGAIVRAVLVSSVRFLITPRVWNKCIERVFGIKSQDFSNVCRYVCVEILDQVRGLEKFDYWDNKHRGDAKGYHNHGKSAENRDVHCQRDRVLDEIVAVGRNVRDF